MVTSLASSSTARPRKGCAARARGLAPAACAALSGCKTTAEFQPAAPTLSAGSSVAWAASPRQVAIALAREFPLTAPLLDPSQPPLHKAFYLRLYLVLGVQEQVHGT